MKFKFLALLLLFSSTGWVDEGNIVYRSPELKNWGLYAIHAIEAWNISEGSKNVVVATIDTGLDTEHNDIVGNIWHDPGLESLYGWDFIRNKANPPDEHGHGTHISGIIGAVLDTRAGISGVAHKVSIMSVRYYSESNPGYINLSNTVRAIEWAVDHGAKIINYSGGGPEFNEAEYLALRKAENNGVLVVAAAGNERQDTDKVEHYYYPAAYHLSNIISVAATNRSDTLISSSNWGKVRVDVAAPGDAIYSTLPGRRFGQMSGTSQATAFVTGLAVLLLAKNPTLTPDQIRSIIIQSVDLIPQLENKVYSGGRINAYSALILLKKKAIAKRPKQEYYRGNDVNKQ